MDKNIVTLVNSEGCPAEKIREYIEGLRNKEKPTRIVLSRQSLNRMANGLVNKIGIENSNKYVLYGKKMMFIQQ